MKLNLYFDATVRVPNNPLTIVRALRASSDDEDSEDDDTPPLTELLEVVDYDVDVSFA